MQLSRFGLCVVFAAFGFARLPAQSYFFNQTSYAFPGAVGSGVKGDLNGDGLTDLAMLTGDTSKTTCLVQVMLGNGQGLATGPVLNCGPYDGRARLVLDDFNGDRIPDIAVANPGAGTVMVWLGNGDGTFQAPVSTAVANLTSVGDLALVSGDFRNNGRSDLVLIEDSAYLVLLSNGDGTFQPQPAVAMSISLGSGVSADFNRDSKLDLAIGGAGVSNGLSYAAVLIGNGDGTFQTAVLYQLAPGGSGFQEPFFMLAADVNLDGNIDLIASYFDGYAVLLGNPQGVFGSPVSRGYALVTDVADFNGDGKPDLLSGTGVLLGNGTGVFKEARPTQLLYFGVGLAADVNGDGRMDLVFPGGLEFTPQENEVTVVLGNGDGTLLPTRAVSFAPASATGIQFAVGDFNGDGKPDVAAISSGTSSGSVYVNLSNGDGSFHQTAALPLTQAVSGLALADFNSDGKLDVVITSQNLNSLTLLTGNGDGTLSQGASFPVGNGPGQVAAADFNGDGKPDAIVANGGGQPSLSVLLGNGHGTFQPQKVTALPGTKTIVGPALAVGDFNRDGHSDAAVFTDPSYSGDHASLTVLLGAGDGTFSSQTSYDPACATSREAKPTITVADLRGNGILDIVLACGSGELVVFLGNGAGTFQKISCPMCPFLYSPVIADFNQDGKLDVAGLDSGSNTGVHVGLGNGDGTFSSFTSLGVNARLTPLVAADFNGDGFPDLAFLGGVLLSNPAPSFSPGSLNFGNVDAGATRKQTVTFTNLGIVPMAVSSIVVKGPGHAAYQTSSDCPSPLLPGAGCTITVTFSPPAKGAYKAAVAITDSAAGAVQTVALFGKGIK